MKIRINPRYEYLRPFVERLAEPGFFDRYGETLYTGRNVVKRFDVGNTALAVKSYGCPSPVNRLVYGSLRKSKAARAYLHAARLRQLGIDSPEEVAAVEIRRGGVMQRSYFVALHTDCRAVSTVTESQTLDDPTRALVDALARFLVRMHRAGVLHGDLNAGNILYEQTASGAYRFCVIDANRMSFRRRLSMRSRLKNLRRMTCGAPAYLYLLQRYAEIMRADVETVCLTGAVRRLLFERRQRAKRNIKNRLRRRGAAAARPNPIDL